MASRALAQSDFRPAGSVYLAALKVALWEEPPAFGTDIYADNYRVASLDGQWLAIALIANAEREGGVARHAWSLAAFSADSEDRQVLKRHAVNESRNTLAYLTLLDLSFPEVISSAFRRELHELSPGYAMEQDLIVVDQSPDSRPPALDDFLQMNIAGLRTAVRVEMLRSALAVHCPFENLPAAATVQDIILRNEFRDIASIGILIERRVHGLEAVDISRLFCRGLREFNRRTSEEPIEFSYHQRFGNYP